jgi:Flp pilus assembly protein TadG
MIRKAALRLPLLARLRGDTSGVTLVEFAFVGPVLILMIIGLFDIAHSQYTLSVLQGSMQKAARDLTLESGVNNQTQIDNFMTEQVQQVMPNNATITIEKQAFTDFNDVGRPEDFTDSNSDGRCNNNEPYIDANGNGSWSPSRGKTGLGSARDAVLYTATVSYPRLFPMAGLAGLPATVTLRGSSVLRNQPFGEQAERGTTQRNCNP